MNAALSIDAVTVSFGGNHVLTGIDLTVGPGFTGLIGPNGAGKTTLFNVISGYVRPSSGRVLLGRHDITAASQTRVARLGVGRTFQTPKLVGDLSVLDNVLIGLDGRSSLLGQVREALVPSSGQRSRRQVIEMFDRFALGRFADTAAGALPLGSQKIVEVCRALITDPSLLLLDEPAAGLGSEDVVGLVEPLRAWVAERGITVVIIEHDLELVTDLCDDVGVLHLGSIISRGTPHECTSDPRVIEAYLGTGDAARS